MRKENVVGVGVGLRMRRGTTTREVALVVMVSRKVPRAQLAEDDLVPGELDGVPVDVQEVGEVRAGGSGSGDQTSGDKSPGARAEP
jgi:hypothetical protein